VTSRIHNVYGVALVFAAALTGCDFDENLTVADGADDAIMVRSGSGSACPIWQCGFNAAEVHGSQVRELNLDGLANGDGVQLLEVVPGPAAAAGGYNQLDVVGDALVLRNAAGAKATGDQLIGTQLVLGRSGSKLAFVTIAGRDAVDRWADGAKAAEAYALVYTDQDGIERNVCTGDDFDARSAVALVLGGETYDLAAKTAKPAARWFTIGCAGSAAAKLSLLGYAPQAGATTVAQRQATLKMITADYCGNGHSYTVNGTPIAWENVSGSVQSGAGDVEAVWTAKGALCLDKTRISDTQVACSIPSCDAFDLSDGEWISYVPVTE
jgi:hypothetical protein